MTSASRYGEFWTVNSSSPRSWSPRAHRLDFAGVVADLVGCT
ncbi:hypothetical protein CU044_5981 [Streptomyces sp. L-9-10]|nr:hypothetical protein [Streptomyces sp. L-9-10]RYJ22210.1 hypothetical protein CU044_5981 [Streptomyces sp. L-9-10]